MDECDERKGLQRKRDGRCKGTQTEKGGDRNSYRFCFRQILTERSRRSAQCPRPINRLVHIGEIVRLDAPRPLLVRFWLPEIPSVIQHNDVHLFVILDDQGNLAADVVDGGSPNLALRSVTDNLVVSFRV